MTFSRRHLLKGIGGAALGLPILEGLTTTRAYAQAQEAAEPFAIFFRQANGVAQAGRTVIGDEPERFYPRTMGPLSPESMADRAVGELVDHRQNLLVVRNVNMQYFDYGDGHANGALQGLTARGPVVAGAGGNAEAAGESIDHRIGRELNPDGRDSLFLYAGQNRGWLGGACISYRASGVRRDATNNPWNAYQNFVSADSGLDPEALVRLQQRQQSVNDLVRAQMQRLLARPELSSSDRSRLQLHFDSVRDLEVALQCRLAEDQERVLEEMAPGFDSTDGDETLETARLHMDVAALAVACGQTRSVAIQVGSGNDGSTRYRNLDSGQLMENYHFLSHRRASHDNSGAVIADSDRLHHFVDVHFARAFRHLLDRLNAYTMPNGETLLQQGVACWYNDNANGPPHGVSGVPWVLAGSCRGFLKQGEMVELSGGQNHSQLLNTIASAVGVRKANGDLLDDFGDPGQPSGLLSAIRA